MESEVVGSSPTNYPRKLTVVVAQLVERKHKQLMSFRNFLTGLNRAMMLLPSKIIGTGARRGL